MRPFQQIQKPTTLALAVGAAVCFVMALRSTSSTSPIEAQFQVSNLGPLRTTSSRSAFAPTSTMFVPAAEASSSSSSIALLIAGMLAIGVAAYALTTRALDMKSTDAETKPLNVQLAGASSAPVTAAAVVVRNPREAADKVKSVKNTKRITEAMRLVASARVRKAQSAVLKGRPFSEGLASTLRKVIGSLDSGDLDVPLLQARDEIKTVGIIVVSGEKGLCGALNSRIILQSELRKKELAAQGIDTKFIFIGSKAQTYWKNPARNTDASLSFPMPGAELKAGDAGPATDKVIQMYLDGEIDKVEIIYTNFISLINAEPKISTIIPLKPTGIEREDDLIFDAQQEEKKEGDLQSMGDMIFEEEPSTLFNSILPLYINSQILKSVQESNASELAARMVAMKAASDNAGDLIKELTLGIARARQAQVTQEISEIVAGANA